MFCCCCFFFQTQHRLLHKKNNLKYANFFKYFLFRKLTIGIERATLNHENLHEYVNTTVQIVCVTVLPRFYSNVQNVIK